MAGQLIRVLVEATPKKVFVSALDWPGLARGAKDEETAIAALVAVAGRYAGVARAAGDAFDPDRLDVDVAERLEGDSGTAYGVPSRVADADREPTDAAEAERLAGLVSAAWEAFDRIAAAAPEELRKGPRGGGRDRTKIVDHVNGADTAYAAVMGRRHRADDRAAVDEMRADLLGMLQTPSDGSPLAGKRWPARYAARRIAWHALDHAWEIEDRSEPG
jgi:hypothetical protein